MFRVIFVPVIALFLAIPSAKAAEGRLDFHIGCIPNAECMDIPYWDGQRGTVRVNKESALSVAADELSDVQLSKDQYGVEQVSLQLGAEAAEAFARVTEANLQKTLAMVADGKVLLAPRIMSAIRDGRIVITLGAGSTSGSLLAAMPWLREIASAEKEKSDRRGLLALLAYVGLGISLIAGAAYYSFFRKERGAGA